MRTKKALEIRLEGITVPYTIRRSRRARRVRLTVQDDGHLVVTVPIRSSLQEVSPMLQRYKRWILKKTKEKNKKRIPPPFELKNGSALKVLDFSYRLVLEPLEGRRTCWSFRNGALLISSPRFSPAVITRCVELWYRKLARLFLEERVPFWAKKLGVEPKTIRVKSQRTIWGSCSLERNLNFNWRILLLSQAAAEYLIIHELTHLKEPNHSPDFWRLVETHCPAFREHKEEIRKKSPWLRYPKNP